MSLRKAIDDKCRDCIYDPLSGLGHWRQQVEACTCTDCPLHMVRPRSTAARAAAKGKQPPALAEYWAATNTKAAGRHERAR